MVHQNTSAARKADSVYRTLKADILSGRIYPNEQLIERELRDRFGVSKTPVREALARLEHEGLLRSRTYRGMQVATFRTIDVLEMYEIREVLEGLAARKCAEGVCRPLEQKLNAVLGQCDTAVEVSEDQFYAYNLEFHGVLCAFCGNMRLQQTLSAIYDQYRFLFSSPVNPILNRYKPGVADAIAEHKEIAAAVLAGDAQLAETKGREHVRRASTRIVEFRTEHSREYATLQRD
jgi:DNA-binding GntR family transcriptional regulator